MRRISPILATSAALLLAASCSSSDSDSEPTTRGTIQGTVVNAPNPVSGVLIVLSGPGGTYQVTTTSNGTYDLSGIPTGFYTVDAYGDGVYDAAGNPIPDKIDLHLPNVFVDEGVASIGGKPLFMPERSPETDIDTSGSTSGTIPAGTVISNPTAGVSLVFDVATNVTFQSADETYLSITQVPVEQTPVALPATISAASIFAVEPAGATFDVAPSIRFPNDANLPIGTGGVSLQRLTFDGGAWTQFGTGTVSADGASIVSDAGQGPSVTGWYAVGVEPFCVTTVTGRVEDAMAAGIEGVLVATVGGRTATTDENGEYSIANVTLPSANFNVVVTALPPVNGGYSPDDSTPVMGSCGAPTNVAPIVLPALAVDTTAPTVTATFPADGAMAVDDNVAMTATFSEAMSPGSLDATTIRLTANGAAVAGDVGVTTAMGQTTVTFVPHALLPTSASCRFTIGAGVKDTAGNRLGSATVVSFDTVAATAGGAPSIDATPNTPAAMDAGDTQQMSVAVLDAAGATINGAIVAWSSDDTTVVRVDATGLVTAVGTGSANVTATFGTISDSVAFTVNTPAVNSVTLSGGQSSAITGSSMVLTATALDAMTNPLQGVSFDWTSSNTSTATVDANGVVRTIAAGGPIMITATDPVSTQSAAFALTVVDPTGIDSVSIMAPATTIGSGTTMQFSAMAFDVSQNPIPGVGFTWSSSNTQAVTVSASGLVTGVGAGEATITATASSATSVSGTVMVNGFLDTPLVVTILGGSDGLTPVPGLRVVRQDATTGVVLDERESNSSGVADFGLTNGLRASVTVFDNDDLTAQEAEFHSFLDVPVGPLFFTWDDAPEVAAFEVDASFPNGTQGIEFIVAGPEGGDSSFHMTSTSPQLFMASARHTQLDGMVSAMAVGGASTGGAPHSAGFLLDQNPMTLTTANVTMTEANVSAVPFTSTSMIVPDDTYMRRSGVLFEMAGGLGQPATSGSTYAAMPPGADRVAFAFSGPATQSDAILTRQLMFNALPATIDVTMPNLEITNLDFDPIMREVQWSTSGTDAAGLDGASVAIEYVFNPVQGQTKYRWNMIFAGTRQSVLVPDLPSDISFLAPGADIETLELEMIGLDAISGFDALVGAIRPHYGNLDQFLMESATDAYAASLEQTPLAISISGTGTGTVTVDWGPGPLTAMDGDVFQVPLDAPVTVAATADMGFTVTAMSSGLGTPTGVGTASASVMFDATGPDLVSIQFD